MNEVIDLQARIEREFGDHIDEQTRRLLAGEYVGDLNARECIEHIEARDRAYRQRERAISERREAAARGLAKYRDAFQPYRLKLANRTLYELGYDVERTVQVFTLGQMLEAFEREHVELTAELDAEQAAITEGSNNLSVLRDLAKIRAGVAPPTPAIAAALGVGDVESLVPAHVRQAQQRAADIAAAKEAELAEQREAASIAYQARIEAENAEWLRREAENLAFSRTIPDSDVGKLVNRLFASGHAPFCFGVWDEGGQGVLNMTASLEYLRRMRAQDLGPHREYLRGRLHEICYARLRGAVGGDAAGRTAEVLHAEEMERAAARAA